MRVSASKMNTWMRCPLQAKFHYVDKLPTRSSSASVFGNCVHSAMEFFANCRDREKTIEWFLKCWDDPSTIGLTIEYWNKRQSFGSLRERGQMLLNGYFERFEREDRRIIAVEHPFKVAFGEHEITGYVDLLEYRRSGRGKNQLRITDYKTGKKPWSDALRNNIQFTAYYYASMQPEFWIGYPGDSEFPGLPDGAALYEEFKRAPRQVIWWSLPTDEEINAGERTQADFNRMYQCVSEMDKAMTYGVYVPCISGDTCTMCDYTQECGVEIPSAVDRLAKVEPF